MAGVPKYRTVVLCGKLSSVTCYGLSKDEDEAVKEGPSINDRDLLGKDSAIRVIYTLNNLGYRVITTTPLNKSDMMWMLEKPLGFYPDQLVHHIP